MLRISTAGFILLALSQTTQVHAAATTTQPAERFRLGIVGLVHGHVYGFLQSAVNRPDVEIVGMAEPRPELLNRYGRHHHKMADSVLFTDLDQMLDRARPQAVAVFTDTADHLKVVQACSQRGIHVMMEKPLAVSAEHAHAMERAASEGKVHVLVNYETTWYPSTTAAWDIVKRDQRLGRIHRIAFHTGNQGPKEINMPREFVEFLTDPARNGAGVLYDFGCYGVDVVTWLMEGRRPTSVTAVTQRLKSDPTYQRVDDEATIVLTYPDAQVVIQASWNWPDSRKDMEIYGQRGSMVTLDGGADYRLRVEGSGESHARANAPSGPNDPISYLIAVATGKLAPSGPSSLKVNVVAAEILDAARRSADTHRSVRLDERK
jgi:predicted dehydrogenase